MSRAMFMLRHRPRSRNFGTLELVKQFLVFVDDGQLPFQDSFRVAET